MSECSQVTTANAEIIIEQSNSRERIDATAYVPTDHLLLLPLRLQYANSARMLMNRVRYYPDFWWHVFLIMQERAEGRGSGEHQDARLLEIARLTKENKELSVASRALEDKIAQLKDEVGRWHREASELKEEKDRNCAVIQYLEKEPRRRSASPPQRRQERQQRTQGCNLWQNDGWCSPSRPPRCPCGHW